MKPKNIVQFRNLVKKYETITLDEIEKAFNKHKTRTFAKQILTGFGRCKTCTLCKKVNNICNLCVYTTDFGCLDKHNEETYDMINNAILPEQLLKAYRTRAKHLRKAYPQHFEVKPKHEKNLTP